MFNEQFMNMELDEERTKTITQINNAKKDFEEKTEIVKQKKESVIKLEEDIKKAKEDENLDAVSDTINTMEETLKDEEEKLKEAQNEAKLSEIFLNNIASIKEMDLEEKIELTKNITKL